MAVTRRNTRIVGDLAPLDYGSTLEFFEGRASRSDQLDRRTITMYQDSRADLAANRDEAEVATILPLLRTDPDQTRVLDVGCGVGRWGLHLAGRVHSYLGFDFSAGLVELANADLREHYQPGRAEARTMSAVDLADAGFDAASFDLVILSGVMAYLNDDDCAQLLDTIGQLGSSISQVYIREPMARTRRLTFDEHWSEELASPYSAVYRSVPQYAELIDDHLASSNFAVVSSFELSPHLANRNETGQFVFLLDRDPVR